jgi:hypothetical protein
MRTSGLSATNQYHPKTTSNAKRAKVAKVAKKTGWTRCFAGFAAFAFQVRRSPFLRIRFTSGPA